MYTDFEIARTVALPYFKARLSGDERGASMVEYALVLALIAVVGVVGLTFLGQTTKDKLCTTGEGISGETVLTVGDDRFIDKNGNGTYDDGVDIKAC